MLKISHPIEYVRQMIMEAQVSSGDAFKYCELLIPNTNPIISDARIYISTQQAANYYSDVFHFWVRSFYDFCGDMQLGAFFTKSADTILCEKMSPKNFKLTTTVY